MSNLHFFDISADSLNLFSFMMGVAFVSLSSIFSGRIFATRLAFFYIAGVALYYGYIKDMTHDLSENNYAGRGAPGKVSQQMSTPPDLTTLSRTH